jgi:hypothetical protein
MSLRIVVLGTMSADPYAGMAWMSMQIAAGLMRCGHDVTFMEVTSVWPYDPIRQMKVDDSDYALPYLSRVCEQFGLAGKWAYRRSYSDKEWFGMSKLEAEERLATADLTINIAGSTRLRTKEGLKTPCLVYYGTDPVYQEIKYAQGDDIVRRTVAQHDLFVSYGENLGQPGCPVPPFPNLKARTRQPVLVDLWDGPPPTRNEYTTVCNWKQLGHEITFNGETYHWSKHYEFMKFMDTPQRVGVEIELAMGLTDAAVTKPGFGELIPAAGMTAEERILLHDNGWKLADAHAFTTDPWQYQKYIQASRGEFSVAKDQNVRLNSGWFSERSACYLAAGRPVITQDTGFGTVLPTGEGLFAFQDMDGIVAAFETVESDYERHSRAARAIAEEYFRAEKVLTKMLSDLGY